MKGFMGTLISDSQRKPVLYYGKHLQKGDQRLLEGDGLPTNPSIFSVLIHFQSPGGSLTQTVKMFGLFAISDFLSFMISQVP